MRVNKQLIDDLYFTAIDIGTDGKDILLFVNKKEKDDAIFIKPTKEDVEKVRDLLIKGAKVEKLKKLQEDLGLKNY